MVTLLLLSRLSSSPLFRENFSSTCLTNATLVNSTFLVSFTFCIFSFSLIMYIIILIFCPLSIGKSNYFKKLYPQVIHRRTAPIIPHSPRFVKRKFNFFHLFHFWGSSMSSLRENTRSKPVP